MSQSVSQYVLGLLQLVCKEKGWAWPEGVQCTEPPAHVTADTATNIAMQLTKALGLSPRDIAGQVMEALQQCEYVTSVEIAGPGFLNITLAPDFFTLHLVTLQKDERLGVPQLSNKRTVVDFGGPNVAKPLHVGHLRSSVIGESIKRLARFAGDTVYGDIHMGDWGTPMGMLIAFLKKEHPEWPYFSDNFTGDGGQSPVSIEDLKVLYPQAASLYKEDPEFAKQALAATTNLQNGHVGYRALWQHFVDVSLAAIKANMAELEVDFDWWYGESHYHNRIAPLIQRLKDAGQAVESEGALIIQISSMPDEPPFILAKSDGSYLYSTTDIAAIDERINVDHIEQFLYVVDQRQKLHFEQLFAVAKQVGLANDQQSFEHLGFGTVNGPDGRPFKTRAGGVMELKDLIALAHEKAADRLAETQGASAYTPAERENITHAVALAALKYADLINHRASDYSFDVDRFTSFEGKTGPYLLYTSARIHSIMRKLPDTPRVVHSIGDVERPLAYRLLGFADEVAMAYSQRAPHILCEALYQLAAIYNQFYHQTNIVSETSAETQQTWLALSEIALREFTLGLQLLGIPSVEKL